MRTILPGVAKHGSTACTPKKGTHVPAHVAPPHSVCPAWSPARRRSHPAPGHHRRAAAPLLVLRRYGWDATYDAVLTGLMLCAHMGSPEGRPSPFGRWGRLGRPPRRPDPLRQRKAGQRRHQHLEAARPAATSSCRKSWFSLEHRRRSPRMRQCEVLTVLRFVRRIEFRQRHVFRIIEFRRCHVLHIEDTDVRLRRHLVLLGSPTLNVTRPPLRIGRRAGTTARRR